MNKEKNKKMAIMKVSFCNLHTGLDWPLIGVSQKWCHILMVDIKIGK